MEWVVERWAGTAWEFHARPLPDVPAPAVWIFEVTAPALVLGSTQPDSIVDLEACSRAGVEVVRRRSGGGAVLLDPDEAVWIDVILPAAHALSDADVGRATWWLGATWARALAAMGLEAVVHHDGMVRTAWSSLVCFAGLGPGEVTVGGAKAVGISQRRTRVGARFQTAVALAWRPERIVGLLSPPFPTSDPVDELRAAVTPVRQRPDQVVEAFLAALPTAG